MAGIFLVGKIYCCWVLDESFFNMWGKFSFYFSFYNSSSCVDTSSTFERKNKLYLYWLVRGNSTRLQSSSSPFWGKSGRMFYRVKKRWIEICPWLCLQQANGQRVGQWATSNGQWAMGNRHLIRTVRSAIAAIAHWSTGSVAASQWRRRRTAGLGNGISGNEPKNPNSI